MAVAKPAGPPPTMSVDEGFNEDDSALPEVRGRALVVEAAIRSGWQDAPGF